MIGVILSIYDGVGRLPLGVGLVAGVELGVTLGVGLGVGLDVTLGVGDILGVGLTGGSIDVS